MTYKAIIFDCDGVLVDSEVLGLDASANYLREHGFSWTPADLVRLFTGYRDDVFKEKLVEEYQRIHTTTPDDAFFEGLVDERRSRRHLLTTINGAEDAIAAMSLPIAVASSSRTEFLHGKLKRVGLFDQLSPHIYSADLVAHGKPAPDIFLYTAEKLSIAPERCLVIEDSVNGVRAGLAANMTVWGFTGGSHCFEGHGERLRDAGASLVVETFDQLTSALHRAP